MDRLLWTLRIGADEIEIIIQVLVAMALGAVIGYDREAANKPAGLRTHMLLAGASALFVALGNIIVGSFEGQLQSGAIRSDPIRLFEAIITGVSFLGAGTIIRHRGAERVEGITTAASLLMTAAIGVTVGLREWFLSVALTILVFLVLHFLGLVKQGKSRGAVGEEENSGSEDL